MAPLLIEIEDKKLKFFKELLQNLPFVTMKEVHPDEDSDEQVLENIREGIKEVRSVEKGEMKSRPARQFLQEL